MKAPTRQWHVYTFGNFQSFHRTLSGASRAARRLSLRKGVRVAWICTCLVPGGYTTGADPIVIWKDGKEIEK